MSQGKLSKLWLALLAGLSLPLGAAGGARSAETYRVDGAHSVVLYKVRHLGMSYSYGRFNEVSGTVVFDDEDPAKSSVEITVQAASIDTNNEKRDRHLRGPDFLDARQFPLITFQSKKVKKVGENRFEVTGELSIRGVTKSLTTTFERVGAGPDPWGHYRAGGHATFTIRRSDFGVSYMPDAIGEEVELTFSVEGVRQ